MDEQTRNAQTEIVEGSEKAVEITSGKKRKFNIPLLVAEVLVLLIAVVILYVVTTTTNEMNRINLDVDTILINDKVANMMAAQGKTQEKGYRNIALFGVDARDNELGKGTRSDTIIIASINQDTHEIKLVSVYRDTYLNLSNDSYNKCNAAYAQGGPEQAISMLNANLDLNITDYVTVGFSGLIEAIDNLGGIEMEVTETEIGHLNNYQLCMAEEMGVDYIPVEKAGVQNLNGMQATAYCRIRYTKGDDFKRAERQRNVLGAMMLKAQNAPLSTLTDVVTAVLPSINTSLNVNEIISVLGTVADYHVVLSEGFPFADSRTGVKMGSKGDCIIPDTLEENVVMLHEILYEEKDYAVSKEVASYSKAIDEQTKEYVN
ncbi:MAG: LCP family protein [Blautia sp.]|nr:LCP family protein [Lachnoclostridium sp.]MCM1211057.1 LCP family protein [Blautia sp.]